MKRFALFLRATLAFLLAFACQSGPTAGTAATVTLYAGTSVIYTGCHPVTPVGGSTSVGGSPSTGGRIGVGGNENSGGTTAAGGISSTGGSSDVVVFPACNSITEYALKAANHQRHKLGGKPVKARGPQANAATSVTGPSVFWRSPCTALDQGNIGSCTGNDATQTSSTPPYKRTCVQADETAALSCYSAATKLDNGCDWNAASCVGAYPPNDTGSYGSSAFKAATFLGWFSGTRSVKQTLQGWHDALLLGPCGFDQPWYNAGFAPSQCGSVALTGGLAGYHSTEVVGFDVENQRMWLRNSWGDWSVEDGYFYYTYANLQKLLSAGATMVCPALPAANDNAYQQAG